MEINNFADQDLIDLKNKQDEKLTRYNKCFNEATERTIKNIQKIEAEMNRRKTSRTFAGRSIWEWERENALTSIILFFLDIFNEFSDGSRASKRGKLVIYVS